jgi:hypothetical protein
VTDTPATLFVVGIGRSGTSLVQSILASHSHITSPPETAFLRRHILSGRLDELFERSGIDKVRQHLESDRNLQRLGVDLDAILCKSGTNDLPGKGVNVYIDILSAYAATHVGTVICDKDPRLLEHLQQIGALFPDAKVLHVVRDPRDVLASKKMAEWSMRRHPLLHIAAGNVQWSLGRRDSLHLGDDRYMEIRYEDILADPDARFREICKWLGLPFEIDMLSFNATAESLISADEQQWKKETLQPLKTANTGKWRSALSPFEVAAVQVGNREIFHFAGYEQEHPADRRHLLSRTAGTLCGWAMRGTARIYCSMRRLREA